MAFSTWRYTSGHIFIKQIHMLKSYPRDFQVWNKAASVWWTCPYNNNLVKHFTWKRRQCNVMKKKTISSIKYICHNKQPKNLYKFMSMIIIQQIITLNIHKISDSDIFLVFFFFKFWTQSWGFWWSLCLLNPSVWCSTPNIRLV